MYNGRVTTPRGSGMVNLHVQRANNGQTIIFNITGDVEILYRPSGRGRGRRGQGRRSEHAMKVRKLKNRIRRTRQIIKKIRAEIKEYEAKQPPNNANEPNRVEAMNQEENAGVNVAKDAEDLTLKTRELEDAVEFFKEVCDAKATEVEQLQMQLQQRGNQA